MGCPHIWHTARFRLSRSQAILRTIGQCPERLLICFFALPFRFATRKPALEECEPKPTQYDPTLTGDRRTEATTNEQKESDTADLQCPTKGEETNHHEELSVLIPPTTLYHNYVLSSLSSFPVLMIFCSAR